MADWDLQEKSGVGTQFYDEENLFYDAIIDIKSDSDVFYDGVGATTVWANQTKN